MVGGIDRNILKELWKLNIHERLKLFLWKVLQDTLPAREQTGRQLGEQDTELMKCELSKASIESVRHLMLDCCFSQILWRESPWPLYLNALGEMSLEEWIKIILHLNVLGIPIVDTHLFQLFAILVELGNLRLNMELLNLEEGGHE